MTLDADALPDAPPPMADPGGVPIGTSQAPTEPLGLPAAPQTGIPQPDIGQMSAELANIQRQKIAANEGQYADFQATLARDKARMTKAYDAAGIGPDDLPSWDAEGAREKFKYDPIQAFGSIGSVFAIIASQFTNRPMENAMLGAASAMNAVKAGNEQEYERSYKAWQDNTNLAIKRQGIQNQQYQNAVSLMTNDMAAGEASIKVNALRYGDKQALFLLENGMNKELLDLFEKRQDMSLKLQKAMPEIAIKNEETRDLMARISGKQPGTPEYVRAVQEHQQDWKGRKYDEDSDFSRQWHADHPDGTAEEFSKDFAAYYAAKLAKLGGGSSRVPKPDEVAINGRADRLIAEAEARGETLPRDVAIEQAKRSYQLATATPSGNKLFDAKGTLDQMDNARAATKKNIEFLESYAGGAGIAGKATRLGERIGNVFGSDETARVDFEKRLAYMKMVAPRLLTMSAGRPLAAEAGNVDKIIAGLGWGDTTANTLAAMRSFDALMDKMQVDLGNRIKDTPGKPGDKPAPKSSMAEPAWKSAPLAAP